MLNLEMSAHKNTFGVYREEANLALLKVKEQLWFVTIEGHPCVYLAVHVATRGAILALLERMYDHDV